MSSGKVFPTLVGEYSGNETHSGMILDPFVSVKHCLSASDTHLFSIWTSTGLASDSTASKVNPKPLSKSLGDETCTKAMDRRADSDGGSVPDRECTSGVDAGAVPSCAIWDRARLLRK